MKPVRIIQQVTILNVPKARRISDNGTRINAPIVAPTSVPPPPITTAAIGMIEKSSAKSEIPAQYVERLDDPREKERVHQGHNCKVYTPKRQARQEADCAEYRPGNRRERHRKPYRQPQRRVEYRGEVSPNPGEESPAEAHQAHVIREEIEGQRQESIGAHYVDDLFPVRGKLKYEGEGEEPYYEQDPRPHEIQYLAQGRYRVYTFRPHL